MSSKKLRNVRFEVPQMSEEIMLLAAEGGNKGEAAALRLQERIESARSAILAVGTGSTRQAAAPGDGE